MTDHNPTSSRPPPPLSSRLRARRMPLLAGAALIILVAGAAAGTGATRLAQRWQPQSVMVLAPTPIARLAPDSAVAVKGSVSEIFGNKFVVQDDSGRALVDLGPRGESAGAVIKDEAVTVQGRFDRGVIHAQVLVHADGRSEAFGPPRPPGPDGGPHKKHGKRADKGPDREAPPPPPRADRGPPPPPAADAPPPPPPAADAPSPPPAPPQ